MCIRSCCSGQRGDIAFVDSKFIRNKASYNRMKYLRLLGNRTRQKVQLENGASEQITRPTRSIILCPYSQSNSFNVQQTNSRASQLSYLCIRQKPPYPRSGNLTLKSLSEFVLIELSVGGNYLSRMAMFTSLHLTLPVCCGNLKFG